MRDIIYVTAVVIFMVYGFEPLMRWLLKTWVRRLALVVSLFVGFQLLQELHKYMYGGVDYVVFSNDGPYGAMCADFQRPPLFITGVWDDTQGVGRPEPAGVWSALLSLRMWEVESALSYVAPLEFWILVAAFVAGQLLRIGKVIFWTNSALVLLSVFYAFALQVIYPWHHEMRHYADEVLSIVYTTLGAWGLIGTGFVLLSEDQDLK